MSVKKILDDNNFKNIERYNTERKVSELLVMGATKYYKVLQTCICNSNKLRGVGSILIQLQNINGGGWELMAATRLRN